ncbi:MAG: lamin tail domain-containing protein [Verrucomicrobiota bacterium]
MQAAPDNQLIARTAEGVSHAGYGPVWQSGDFNVQGWGTGRAPFGFGHAAVVTDTRQAMAGRTPTLYLRKVVTLTAEQATRAEALLVKVAYDDGFVLWINGREVTRANLGPPGQHVYHHQVTYRAGIAQTSPPAPAVMEMSPGPVREWLKAGENVVAAVVSNRNLGSETGGSSAINNGCFLNVSLSVFPAQVDRELDGADFAESNGASRTFLRLPVGIQETASGTPPEGSWLLRAQEPVIPVGNTGLSVTAEAVTGPGSGAMGPGAMRWTVSQTGGGAQSAEFRGAPLSLPGLNGWSEEIFSRLAFSFRWRLGGTAGGAAAAFGFRLEEPGGTVLTGFPDIEDSGPKDPAPGEYLNLYGGSRTLRVAADGVSSVASAGLLRGNPVLSAGPALKNAVFRVTEDNTAGAGYGGSAGALKCEMTTATGTADEVRMMYGGVNAALLKPGEITADDWVNIGFSVAVKAPAGRAVRIFLEPEVTGAAVQDQLDFGSVTGTGAWQALEFPLASAANAEAARARINALKPATFRLGVAFSGNLPAGQAVWVDRTGLVTLWRTYRVNLDQTLSPSKGAFRAALGAVADRRVTAVFTKLSNPVSSAVQSLTVDDVRLLYRESGGVTEAIIPEAGADWRFYAGLSEPAGGVGDDAGDWVDWIELHNDGPDTQDLSGWHLTDDPGEPRKWTFPQGYSMLGGDRWLIFADGKNAGAPSGQLHTNFGLKADGGDLALVNPAGAVVSAIRAYPKQDSFHTWGRGEDGTYGYLSTGTPGEENRGQAIPLHCDKPDFSVPPGFHDAPVSLAMATDTAGGEIRYTLDGSEPVGTSPLYTAPVALGFAGKGRGHCVRARTFKAGAHASNIRTATYLIGQDARLRSAPAVCLSGDEGITFFKPYGVTAIQGGTRPNDLWQADKITDYNNALGDLNNQLVSGQAWERPVTLEYLPGDGRAGFNEDIGIRVSGSPFSRPRYELDNIATLPWSYTNLFEKPSFNLWWRGAYGNDQLEYPLFGEGYPVEKFEHLRLRGGHNDMPNPFVKDELVRRIYTAMGRPGARGTFNPVFVNAKFAGVYNLCERVREPFMREHFGGKNDWDVIQRGEIANGDELAFQDLLARVDRHTAAPTAANYAQVLEKLDVESFVDYVLLNCWTGTGDWPHNNWIASCERAPGGKWRWFPWDAEGAFGGFSKTLGYNILAQDLLVDVKGPNREICRVYSSLRLNPEFRLTFADAVNRHLCNSGALTDARLTALKTQVIGEYQPLLSYILSATVNDSFFTGWVSGTAMDKRDVLFRSAVLTISGTTADYGYQFPVQNVWPALEGKGTWQAPLPPLFNQHGGTAAAGFRLVISHSSSLSDRTADNPYRVADNQAPADRVIYYTTDGTDPRLAGGAVSAAAAVFSGPLTLPEGTVTVKSRIRSTRNSEWSPLTAADFQPTTVAANAENLVIAEIMYHPPDATAQEPGYTDQDDFEFVRLLNTGTAPVSLRGLRFTVGVDFNFEGGAVTVLNPRESVLVVSKPEAFRLRYGAALAARVAGQYAGNLSNSGERLRLEDSGGILVQEFTYDDAAPWPVAADGAGPSLVLRGPWSRPDPRIPENWTTSAMPGGLGTEGISMTYARWRDFLWPSGGSGPGTGSGAADDPDGDGVPNLMEYALGTDPHLAGAPELNPELREESGGKYLSVSFCTPAGAGNVEVTVESGDGTAWASGPSAVVQSGAPEVLPDGRVRHRWRDAAPVGQHGRRFLRLRAVSK